MRENSARYGSHSAIDSRTSTQMIEQNCRRCDHSILDHKCSDENHIDCN